MTTIYILSTNPRNMHHNTSNIFSSCTAQKEDTQAVLTECEASGEVQSGIICLLQTRLRVDPIQTYSVFFRAEPEKPNCPCDVSCHWLSHCTIHLNHSSGPFCFLLGRKMKSTMTGTLRAKYISCGCRRSSSMVNTTSKQMMCVRRFSAALTKSSG